MADISDVTALLAQMAATACFPNGASSPSVTGNMNDIRIFEGWPLQKTLDADMANGVSNVSIFPTPGSSAAVFQVLDEFYVISPPTYGLAASISGDTVTLSGTPGTGEYASIVADGLYCYSRVGASANAILTAIAADAAANYSGVSVSGNSITFPTSRLVCHLGAPGTMGKVTHRQKDSVIISIWAPTNALRNTIAMAVDVAFKAVNHLTFPDTSQGVLAYSNHRQMDTLESANIYRRDLIYTVEYATLLKFQAWTVTSVDPTIDVGPSEYGSSGVFNQAWG